MGKSKNNPWAICGENIKDQDSAKYERCVKKVKKKIGYKESAGDDIRKISEMLTDDPNIFVEEGMPMEPMGGMEGGDAPTPPMGGEEMPADDMASDMSEEEVSQWVVMTTGAENKAVGPFGSREEAMAELQKCAGGEAMPDESGTVTTEHGTMAVVELQAPGQEDGMPGEMGGDEVGGEDLPPMDGGEEPLGGAPPPADNAGGVPPTEDMVGGY